MKQSLTINSRKVVRLPQKQWDLWLSRLEKSGLSASAFARRHGLNYAALCRWRKKRQAQAGSTRFVEVDCSSTPRPPDMLVEHRCGLRIAVRSECQVDWAASLIKKLTKARAC